MPILSTDLMWFASTTKATSGYSLPSQGINSSLGGYISTTSITDNVINNLFADVDGNENVSSQSLYQCIFFLNNNQLLTLTGAVVWILNQISGGATIAIAKDIIGPISATSPFPQADRIATPAIAPVRVGAFSSPLTKSAGILLGDIGPQQCVALWLQRSAANTLAMASDGVSLRVEGGTVN